MGEGGAFLPGYGVVHWQGGDGWSDIVWQCDRNSAYPLWPFSAVIVWQIFQKIFMYCFSPSNHPAEAGININSMELSADQNLGY